MSTSRVQQFNTGPWTEEEHQGFLMALEEHHRGGGWSSFERCISTRSRLQIDAYTRGYFAATAEPEEGQAAPSPEQVDQSPTTTAAAVVAAHQQSRGVPGGHRPYPALVVWESLTGEEATRRAFIGDDPWGIL